MSLVANQTVRLDIPRVGIFDEHVDRIWLIPYGNKKNKETINVELQKRNPDYGQLIIPDEGEDLSPEDVEYNNSLVRPDEEFIPIHRSGPYNIGECETNMTSETRAMDIHNFALTIFGAENFTISDLNQ